MQVPQGIPGVPAAHLQHGPQLVPGQVTVAQNLSEQAATDRFSAVSRHHSATTVRMLQEVMAAPDSNHNEAQFLEGLNEALAGERWKAAHAGTETRWTPTN